jgi:hypothetical protein
MVTQKNKLGGADQNLVAPGQALKSNVKIIAINQTIILCRFVRMPFPQHGGV